MLALKFCLCLITIYKSHAATVELQRQTRFAWNALCNYFCDDSPDPESSSDFFDYEFDGRFLCTQMCGQSPTKAPSNANCEPAASASSSNADAMTTVKDADDGSATTTEKSPATDFEPTPKPTSDEDTTGEETTTESASE